MRNDEEEEEIDDDVIKIIDAPGNGSSIISGTMLQLLSIIQMHHSQSRSMRKASLPHPHTSAAREEGRRGICRQNESFAALKQNSSVLWFCG